MSVHFLELDEDEGISGYVISPQFEGMTSLQRQEFLNQVLVQSSDPLTRAERRQILMIAALAPAEYRTTVNKVFIDQIHEVSPGKFKIILDGGLGDAHYLRQIIDDLGDATTTEPQPALGSAEGRVCFWVQHSAEPLLTMKQLVAYLDSKPQIGILADLVGLNHPA